MNEMDPSRQLMEERGQLAKKDLLVNSMRTRLASTVSSWAASNLLQQKKSGIRGGIKYMQGGWRG